ncbi:hypothetical protein RRG08_047240 [Elysia crispata]|uniref:Uncharacterized protein n=1 Tax=Elysia crispata TaxID=231223 RepID=A0AAE1A370_9GAST|nr:hypothetical protein RRG08_047240 [Elysia crispata]
MPVRRGHVAPPNIFIDTIIRKFDGQIDQYHRRQTLQETHSGYAVINKTCSKMPNAELYVRHLTVSPLVGLRFVVRNSELVRRKLLISLFLLS